MGRMSDFYTLRSKLVDILSSGNIVTDQDACKLYSQDVYSISDHTVRAVIKPDNITELSKAIKEITSAEYAIIPRGGGMSYTGGYLPTNDKAIALDIGNMNKIIEINLEDMFITVEAGCTWSQINQALKDHDVRPPFWGTLSGLHATVGGGVSQNSLFFGSGLYGSAVDSVIGLEIIAANGDIIRTGSASVKGGNNFFRHYGPDITGIFLGDTGALGIKAHITLKLIPNPKYREFGSFSFEHYKDMLPAMSEISRRGLASECFGFDPYLQEQRMKRESITKDIKNLSSVLKASENVFDAVKKGTKLAVAGRRYMNDVIYSFHATSENKYKGSAKADMVEIKEIALKAGGKEIENSIPTLVNANPFLPLNNIVGPEGERWVPVHGLTSHSKIVDLHRVVDEIFESNQEIIDKYKIGVGYMYVTVGTNAALIEPVFFWQDQLKELHLNTVEKNHLKSLKGFDENLEIRDAVNKIRSQLINLFMDQGAIHLQIGKSYLYREGLEEKSFNIVEKIKNHMDPNGLINPGSLGL